jgi:poly(glycerol-phosphate) alpha-glucosyltransferase
VLWPLAVDPTDTAELPPRGRLRGAIGIANDAPLVLFVGRISELKGIAPLIRAFARADVKAAHLAIVGRDDGFLEAARAIAREAGVAERVHFPGPMYGPDAVAAYVDCDVFSITPTHFEETSLASLAACACGRPVVINDRCDIPWLDDYQAGLSVVHDEGAIADALRLLLGDRERRETMGRNARRMVEERFFAPRIVDQIDGIYRAAVEGQKR